MNELKLRGKACQIKNFDWGSRFAINFYAGKDQNGKAIYAFIDCKSFKVKPQDREIIEATGWLSYEQVKYNDKNLSRLVYVVTGIEPYKKTEKAEKQENYTEVEPDPFLDDDLGF